MQAEETIEINYRPSRNVDAGSHRVILGLGVRHHNIQTVRGAALKDHNQALGSRARRSRAHSGASEKTRHSGRADDSECAVAKKYATCDGHKKTAPGSWLLALGSIHQPLPCAPRIRNSGVQTNCQKLTAKSYLL